MVFSLTISKVSEQIFCGDAESITLPGQEGEFTIHAHHEPLISLLTRGTIKVRTQGSLQIFNIDKGICETSNNQVTILV